MITQFTRKQIQQINDLFQEYPDAEDVVIRYDYGCPIGTNMYATVKYCGYKSYEIDITDYENW